MNEVRNWNDMSQERQYFGADFFALALDIILFIKETADGLMAEDAATVLAVSEAAQFVLLKTEDAAEDGLAKAASELGDAARSTFVLLFTAVTLDSFTIVLVPVAPLDSVAGDLLVI